MSIKLDTENWSIGTQRHMWNSNCYENRTRQFYFALQSPTVILIVKMYVFDSLWWKSDTITGIKCCGEVKSHFYWTTCCNILLISETRNTNRIYEFLGFFYLFRMERRERPDRVHMLNVKTKEKYWVWETVNFKYELLLHRD